MSTTTDDLVADLREALGRASATITDLEQEIATMHTSVVHDCCLQRQAVLEIARDPSRLADGTPVIVPQRLLDVLGEEA